MQVLRIIFIGVLSLALACCTMLEKSTPAPDTAREDLEAQWTATQQAQQHAKNLWDRVITGEAISCEEGLMMLSPVALTPQDLARHPEAESIQVELNTAIRALRTAAEIWDSECADGRAYIPLSVARAAWEATLAAESPLITTQMLLASWPIE